MKKFLLISIFSFFGLILFNVSPGLAAKSNNEEIAGSTYAVVNVMYVMSQSKAVENITKQVNAYKDKLEKQAQIKQDELQQTQQDLIKKQNEMSPKEFENVKKQFQVKVQTIQQDLYEKSRTLEKVKEEALMVIEKSIGTIIDELAHKNNYELVFQSAALARYPTHKDISKEVVEKLNKNTPSVNVKKPF